LTGILQMTDIRTNLEAIAVELERLDRKPAAAPVIHDRELSGNKINGGIITNFASAGIKDNASTNVLVVEKDRIVVDTASISTIPNALQVDGALTVNGAIYATQLHVDEITADVRNERTSPLEFRGENNQEALGKGVIWTGGKYTKQFVLQQGDRLWSSEHIDLHESKTFRIANETVISKNALGAGVTESNLKSVGTLTNLRVNGNLDVDEFFRYDANSQQLVLGAETPNGMLTMESWDHQFIIDPTEDRKWKLGTWTTSALNIVTDDTTRIAIGESGNVTVTGKTNFERGVGIGVKNFTDDADLTVAGAVRFQGKKQEVGESIPTNGNYSKGDIVWNSNPTPTAYVGWVCVREGSPGEWKRFGQIAS
jgi:hypothetical protein